MSIPLNIIQFHKCYILTALTLIWTSVLGTYLLATMNQNLSEDEAAVKSEVVLTISTWYVFQVQWCAGRFYYFWRVSWATSPVLLSCWGQRCQLGVTSGSSDQEMHLCDCPWLLQPVGPKHQPPNCLVNSPVGCTKIRGTARENTSSTLGGNTYIKREQLRERKKMWLRGLSPAAAAASGSIFISNVFLNKQQMKRTT